MVIKLRKYQEEAVKFTLKEPLSLLAMRVGSGKTICAMFSMRALLKKKIIDKAVVACSVSSVSVFVEDFKDKANIDVNLVENVESFLEFLDSKSKVCLIKHSFFEKVGNDLYSIKKLESYLKKNNLSIQLIIDEAHKMQNPDGVAQEAYHRMNFVFDQVVLLTATPYSSCLSQFYGLINLIHPEIWRNKRDFFNNYIEEKTIVDPRTHRVVRKEKVRYHNLKDFREKIEPFTYFYFPKVPLVHLEFRARLNDYKDYDDLCKGILTDKDREKLEKLNSKK